MQPIVHGLEQTYGNQLAFGRLDADVEPGRTLLREYGLRGHPSYVIVDPDGKSLWSATGILSEGVLIETINQFLQ